MGGKKRATAWRSESGTGSRELAMGILEAAPGGIVHVDLTGAVQHANDEALRILGMSYDQLTEQFVVDFETETILEDGSPCPASSYPVTQALITGKAQPRMTIGVRLPDGTLSWAVFTAVPIKDEAGVVTGAVATFLDISSRIAMEEELRLSEATLRSVVSSAPSLILATDASGHIKYLNRSMLPHREVGSLIGASLYEALPEENEAEIRACVDSVLTTGKSSGFEMQVGAGENALRYVIRVGPVHANGEVTGVALSAADITEIRKLQVQLIESERLASLGTLAAGVAHEINNPLTYILIKLRRLLKQAEARGGRPERIEDLRAATEGSERIARIVRDLGGYARSGAAQPGAVDVNQVVKLAADMASSETRYRAKVRYSLGVVPPAFGDETHLAQVFLNLIINAAQAIAIGNIDDNEIHISSRLNEAGMVVIEVADTGAGIAPDLIGRVFEPFVTTKGVGEGTGLGLHICRQIVASVGGEIYVDSAPGRGARFTVVLARAQRDTTTPVETVPPKEEFRPVAPLAALQVLVVDDEPLICSVLERHLESHAVTIAHSGRLAIEFLDKADFDLILCDLMMTDLTGMDVYRHLQAEKRGREDKMVFMTGGTFTMQSQEFVSRITNPILKKPFRLEDLDLVLMQAGARRLDQSGGAL